jgi:hypothetical protein
MKRLLALLLFLPLAATAQLRTIPQDAKRGEIRHVHDMLVEIDGTQQRLSPGAQIRDVNNRLVLPVSLSEKSEVKYQLDARGLVHRVWILSAKEK